MPHPTQTYESHSFWWLVWMDRHLKVSTTRRESICCFIRFLSLYNLAAFYTFKTFLRFFLAMVKVSCGFPTVKVSCGFFFPLSRFLAFFSPVSKFLAVFFTTVKVSCFFFPLSEFLAVVVFHFQFFLWPSDKALDFERCWKILTQSCGFQKPQDNVDGKNKPLDFQTLKFKLEKLTSLSKLLKTIVRNLKTTGFWSLVF